MYEKAKKWLKDEVMSRDMYDDAQLEIIVRHVLLCVLPTPESAFEYGFKQGIPLEEDSVIPRHTPYIQHEDEDYYVVTGGSSYDMTVENPENYRLLAQPVPVKESDINKIEKILKELREKPEGESSSRYAAGVIIRELGGSRV